MTGPTPVLGVTWNPHELERAELDRLPEWRVLEAAGERSPVWDRVDALAALARHISPDLLDALPALRLVHLPNHGVDGLERPDIVRRLRDRGVQVAAAAQAGPPIAEFVMMCLVALTRRLALTHAAMILQGGDRSAGLRRQRMDGAWGGELQNSHLVVLGYGTIGREVARRASAFGMRVTAVKRRPLGDLRDEPIDACLPSGQIEVALEQADHLVVCVPLSRETERLLDARRLRLLPRGACLVNVARGRVIDERAAFQLVADGHLGGAAFDVWANDEGADGLQPDPAWQHLNVLATPHYAASTREARVRSIRFIADNVQRFRAGATLRNPVELGTR
ncbi:NAD(P)-dependent oxidoreductase [Egicoccus halophilus]|nr:NAD(P)-dependent oxidoreductase [Egicoccus halophilus]